MDTAHALIDPDTAARELLYVALTRARLRNEAYVIQPDPHEVESHLDRPDALEVTGQLARELVRSDEDVSATETLTLEVDRHPSLSTLPQSTTYSSAKHRQTAGSCCSTSRPSPQRSSMTSSPAPTTNISKAHSPGTTLPGMT